jgi:hypothetical protein
MHTYSAGKDEAKQQVTSLFQIYGAIDQRLQLRPRTEEPHPVELLLPVYGEADDPHWYGRFVEATGGEAAFDATTFDPVALVHAALEFLATYKPGCRMRARRLYAVGAVALTFSETEISNQQLVDAALGAREAELLSSAGVQRLAELLRSRPGDGPSAAARDEWWRQLLGSGLIPEAEEFGPPPSACSYELLYMDVNGDMDYVPTFMTVLEAALSFEDAKKFCDPMRWICFPSWCGMEDRGRKNGVHQYRETVSFKCGDEKVLALTVDLDFADRPIDPGPPKVAITQYKLSDIQPENYVLVNEGRLEICELSGPPDPKVRITTTKSIKFSSPLDSAGLATFMCLVGYASMVEDLICCASKQTENGQYPDTPFVGHPPAAEPQTAATAAWGHAGASRYGASRDYGTTPDYAETQEHGKTPQYGGLLKVMVDETAAAAEQCLDECTKAAKASYAKLENGYTADELAQDMADWWVRMIREGARFADIWLRIVQKPGKPDYGSAPPAATPKRAEL